MEDKTQSEPATKGDLVKLTEAVTATKGDLVKLTETVAHLAINLSKTQADVRQIKDDMATKMSTKDDISRVMSAIDAFAAEALSYRNHDTLRGDKIMAHEEKLENHEGRLVLLESPK
jgi:hypothetical protein